MIFLFCAAHCLPAIPVFAAIDPSKVFSGNGKVELFELKYLEAKNKVTVSGSGPLHFTLEDSPQLGEGAVTLRFFNASPRWNFKLMSSPQGIVKRAEIGVVPEKDERATETRITLMLETGWEAYSSLSPNTKEAVINFKKLGDPTAGFPRRIVVRHLEYSNARDIANILSLMVPQGNGRVAADESRNNLVLDNSNGDFDTLGETIKDLDRPSYQVVLEAQVAELNSNAARNLGFTYSTNLSTTLSEQPPEGTGGFNTQPIPLQPVVRTSASLQATLNMLQSSGQAKILANPRVAALEGEESKIITGERIPYFVTQVSGNQVFQIKEDFLAGVELRIIPRVNEGRFITARINTNVSTITGTTAQGYPQLSTRESQAVVRVGAGQTIVIGGLLQEREIELLSGLPFVSDLPIIGSLFSSRQKDKVKTELVVFITPHILSDTQ